MKVTSKQADATLEKLTSVMQRNTALATSTPVSRQTQGPVATYTPQASLPLLPKTGGRSASSGIRLKPADHEKIRRVIQAGLELQETLVVSDVIRIALAAYAPRKLTSTEIVQLRATDGRKLAAKARAEHRTQ